MRDVVKLVLACLLAVSCGDAPQIVQPVTADDPDVGGDADVQPDPVIDLPEDPDATRDSVDGNDPEITAEPDETPDLGIPPAYSLTYSSLGMVVLVHEVIDPLSVEVRDDLGDIVVDGLSFEVDPELPDGFAFDTDTGSVSGTPAARSPTTAYTVRVTGPDGFGLTALGITVTGRDRLRPIESIIYDTSAVDGSDTLVTPDSLDESEVGTGSRWARASNFATEPAIADGVFRIEKTESEDYAFYYRQTPQLLPFAAICSMVPEPRPCDTTGFGNVSVLEVEVEFVSANQDDLIDSENGLMPFRLYLGDGLRRYVAALVHDTGDEYRIGFLNGRRENWSVDYAKSEESVIVTAGTLLTIRLVRDGNGDGYAEVLGESGELIAATARQPYGDLTFGFDTPLPGTEGPNTDDVIHQIELYEDVAGESSGPDYRAGYFAFGVVNDGGGTYDVYRAEWEIRDHDDDEERLPDAGRVIDFGVIDHPGDTLLGPSSADLTRSPAIVIVDTLATGLSEDTILPLGPNLGPPGDSLVDLCDFEPAPGDRLTVLDPLEDEVSEVVVADRFDPDVDNSAYVLVQNIGRVASIQDGLDIRQLFDGSGAVRLFATGLDPLGSETPIGFTELIHTTGPSRAGEPFNVDGAVEVIPEPFWDDEADCGASYVGPFTLTVDDLSRLGLDRIGLLALVFGRPHVALYGDVEVTLGFLDPPPDALSLPPTALWELIRNDNNLAYRWVPVGP
jgi:hypothetical protein